MANYAQIRSNYQKECAKILEKLIEEVKKNPGNYEEFALSAYGPDATVDEVEGTDLVLYAIKQMTSVAETLNNASENLVEPKDLDALINNWQYVVHGLDVEMERSVKFVKNLNEDVDFRAEQQKALLGFLELEAVFKAANPPTPPEDSPPSPQPN